MQSDTHPTLHNELLPPHGYIKVYPHTFGTLITYAPRKKTAEQPLGARQHYVKTTKGLSSSMEGTSNPCHSASAAQRSLLGMRS